MFRKLLGKLGGNRREKPRPHLNGLALERRQLAVARWLAREHRDPSILEAYRRVKL